MSIRPPVRHRGRWILQRWIQKGRFPIIIGLAVITFLISRTDWFKNSPNVYRWEDQAYDHRLNLRGPLPPHPDVVVVGVTSSSLDRKLLESLATQSEAIRLMHEHPSWPWPRSIHAHVIERLLSAGAKTVAVDFVFWSEMPEDESLAAVLKKYPNRVVLAATMQETVDDSGRTHKFIQLPNSRLQEAAGPNCAAFVTYNKSGDGTHRHFDYRTSEVNENETLKRYLDDPRDLWKFSALAVHKFTRRDLPTDYSVPINFTGPANSYAPLPVENLFDPNVWANDRRYRNGEAFRDKLVLYGPIAEIFHDTLYTPFGAMPGVEVHANVAANLLRGDLLRNATSGMEGFFAALATLATAASILWLRHPLLQLTAVAGIGLIYWISTQLAFVHGHLIVPVVPAFFTIAATGLLGSTYLFIVEQWEKARTRKVLERSVNKRIAKVMMQNAEEFDQARKGERRKVAILFSDIRSFTTWSEKAEPEHLVGQLNEYFERMVELVEREDSLGNAQKFIGDAILAAWGDTPENQFGDGENTRRALTVALRMRVALQELNAAWNGRSDRLVISIGVGINHGEVVVGEVGHPERREYTVLGDGVNFAARLESATKQFHTDCLVGETVEALTRQHFVFRHVDYVRVKGKSKPVNIYIPLSDSTVPPPEWLHEYHRARALYVQRQFTEAAALFCEVKQRIGAEDYLCDMYAERCNRYAQEAPPADWDGSFTMTEK